MKKYIYLVFLILLLTPTICTSAPTAASVDGSVLTISGSFTANASPGPIDYLGPNIESGTDGGGFSKSGWTTGSGIVYTTSDSFSGSKSLYADLEGLDFTERSMASELETGNQTTIYMSTMMKTKLTFPVTCDRFQLKAFRFKNDAGYTMDTGFFIDAWWYQGSGFAGNGDLLVWEDGANSGNYWNITDNPFVDDTWERYEITLNHSDPSTANGSMEMIRTSTGTVVGTAQGDPKTAHETRSVSSDYYSHFRLQAYFLSLKIDGSTPCSDTDITNSRLQVYFDDLYISNTPERVEVSTSPTWEGAVDAEVLVTLTKTTGEITATYSTTLVGNVYAYEILPTGLPSNANGVLISSTAPVVTLQEDKQATSPTTYTGSFTVKAGKTASTVVSSNGFTVTCNDGDCTDETTEAFTVSGVTVPITDVITVTDSSAETGNDSITITLPTPTPTSSGTIKGATVKRAILK